MDIIPPECCIYNTHIVVLKDSLKCQRLNMMAVSKIEEPSAIDYMYLYIILDVVLGKHRTIGFHRQSLFSQFGTAYHQHGLCSLRKAYRLEKLPGCKELYLDFVVNR
jgi:hypothetical protein